MTTPRTNGYANAHGPPRNGGTTENQPATHEGNGSLLDEAQALKLALRDAFSRATRLVAAIKRQRRQSKLVASTLASLKTLRQLDA